jgi:hypothetical protein
VAAPPVQRVEHGRGPDKLAIAEIQGRQDVVNADRRA